jgi:CubicO group peptidase (beta-lactamase class C family)
VVDKTPGGFFRYSGGGYCIVQQALIDVSGKPFPVVMRETVLDPLGMSQSTFEQPLPSSRASMAAAAHNIAGDVIPGLSHTYPEMAAAGLWTTAEDLARLLIDLQRALAGETDRLLSPEMVKVMMTPVSGNYGLGVLPESVNGARYFRHSGVNAGFRATFIGHRTNRKGMVLLTNGSSGGFLGEVQSYIARREDWPGY